MDETNVTKNAISKEKESEKVAEEVVGSKHITEQVVGSERAVGLNEGVNWEIDISAEIKGG